MNQNILFLFGGKSCEHEISIISARNIVSALDQSLFNPILVGISKDGIWYSYHTDELSDPSLRVISKRDFSCTLIRDHEGVFLLSGDGTRIKIDRAFPVLHGPYGEDGTIQGLFEFFDLPYVGCGVLSSSLCMDKITFKKVMTYHGINVTPYLSTEKGKEIPSYTDAVSQFKSHILFVKPSRMGSSLGVSKVRNEKQYNDAIKHAFSFDTRILIEKSIPHVREIEGAILKTRDCFIISPLGEIVPSHDFYNYDAKYIDPKGAELFIPSILEKDIVLKIQDISKNAFDYANCHGMARVDFLIDNQTKEIYLNEINTIPGFTNISMYPKLLMIMGISYKDLISGLILDSFVSKNQIYSAVNF